MHFFSYHHIKKNKLFSRHMRKALLIDCAIKLSLTLITYLNDLLMRLFYSPSHYLINIYQKKFFFFN